MKSAAPSLPLSLLLAAGLPALAGAAEQAPPRPKTRIDPVRETLHGVELADPYRWLEDQKSPETRAWIDEQNRYTEAILGRLPGRDRLKQRITELMKVDAVSIPFERSGRYFFTRRKADQDLSVLYTRLGAQGK